MSKLDELSILASDADPDIILVTESWCNNQVTNSMLNISGYTLEPDLRVDRSDTVNGIGGGLLVYSRINLVIKAKVSTNTFNQFCSFDIVGENNTSLTVHLIYRSPNSSDKNTELLYELVQNSASSNTMFIGDFNLPNINWSNGTSDRKSNNFFMSTQNKFLTQIIDFPNQIKGNILDLALVNCPERVLSVESLGNVGNSDHNSILVEFFFDPTLNKSEELINDWKNADTAGLNQFLQDIDWVSELNDKNTDEAWGSFKTVLNLGMEKFVPKILRRKGGGPSWMTKTLKKLCRKKQNLWNIYSRSKDLSDFENFKAMEKNVKAQLSKLKNALKERWLQTPIKSHISHM